MSDPLLFRNLFPERAIASDLVDCETKLPMVVTDSIELRSEDGGRMTLLPQMHVWVERSSFGGEQAVFASFQWRTDGTIACTDERIEASWDEEEAMLRVKTPSPTMFFLDSYVRQYTVRWSGEEFEIKPAFAEDTSFAPYQGSAEAVHAFWLRHITSLSNPERAEKLSETLKGYLALAVQCPGQRVLVSQ